MDRLDPADIDAFIADQHRDGRRHGVFRQGLVLLRAYLVDVRAVPADHPSARDVVGELVDSYCEWLLRERGLARNDRAPLSGHRPTLPFSAQRAGGVDLNDLTAAEVSAFLLAPAGMTPASRRGCRLTRSGLCWTVATRLTPVGIRNYWPSRPTAWSRSSERRCPGDRDRGDAAVTHTTDQEHLAALGCPI